MIMEKNDCSNVSTENALDGLSMKEIERLEAYYMAEAECLMAFGGQEKKEPLTFMLKHLRATECLFKTLQFPWEESVAVLYGSFMHYVALEERKESGKCLPDFMTELIKRMKFLAQKGPLITALFRRYQGQRKEVEALVALKKGELNEQQ
jgi:hypothetical protein